MSLRVNLASLRFRKNTVINNAFYQHNKKKAHMPKNPLEEYKKKRN